MSRVFPTQKLDPGCEYRGMATSVLVVDDDPAFRALAERLLTAISLDVVGQADSAAGAVAVARALQPDSALVDIELPDRDGIALARELVALPWRPRVLLTSIDADAASPEDVRRSGASGFVHKAELPSAALARMLARD
jgi:DNA-binding NarL/FixJ family response regulator